MQHTLTYWIRGHENTVPLDVDNRVQSRWLDDAQHAATVLARKRQLPRCKARINSTYRPGGKERTIHHYGELVQKFAPNKQEYFTWRPCKGKDDPTWEAWYGVD